MPRLVILLLVVAACGCGASESEQQAQEDAPQTASSGEQAPPRTVDELFARLPPFDEPASPEVDAYRRATIGAFYDRCVNVDNTAVKRAFVRANAALLDEMPVFPGARFANEYSIDHRDGNGCLEGMGPATSYSTYRNYRLPTDASRRSVTGYYERELAGWGPASASGDCERSFTRGDALFAVRACNDSLTLTARALEQREPPPAPALPPRPTGEQYPETTKSSGGPGEPSGYEAQPGETCERGEAYGREGMVPIIVPPAPGVRARVEDKPFQLGSGTFDRAVVVEWWFDRILGDCPPTRLHLTLVNPTPGSPPLSLPYEVHARSGEQRLPLLDSFRSVAVLLATAESLDGTRSRTAAILIRR